MRTWDDLSDLEREFMILADDEAMLWELHDLVEELTDTAGAAAVGLAQRVAEQLVREGFLWFYRLEEGYPPLSKREVVALLQSGQLWVPDDDTGMVTAICLYSTYAGDQLLDVG
ncbi:MAG: hypothetical protein U0R78_14080 [Nocardioidaceae bacterium]